MALSWIGLPSIPWFGLAGQMKSAGGPPTGPAGGGGPGGPTDNKVIANMLILKNTAATKKRITSESVVGFMGLMDKCWQCLF